MIHLYLILSFFYIGQSQAISCVMEKGVCMFSGVWTNETNLYFNPTAENVSIVDNVEFKTNTSYMPILTDELCKAFPKMNRLKLYDLKLTTIQPNAFHECKVLTHLSFYANYLETLDPNLFEKNPEIVTFSIQNNELPIIDPDVFIPMKKLKFLVLAENHFTNMPLEQFPILASLDRLDLFVNDLTDLDEQELLYKFPNLTTIILHNNLFNCERLQIILNFLKRNGVKLDEFFKFAFTRNLGATTIDNVECLSEEDRFRKLQVKIRNESDSDVLGSRTNYSNIDPELKLKQEALEDKVFYLIITCGVLLSLVVLVSLIFLVGCFIRNRTEQEYYSNYYYSEPKM